MKKLSDFDLLKFGDTSTLAGVVYTGTPNILFWLPGQEDSADSPLDEVAMSDADWKELLNQTDDVNVRVLIGIEKAIMRKSLRAIDQSISWHVYDRDGYKCRYCCRRGVPLSVDHIDLWENGGATIPENLLTACKKCNKTRGNMLYKDWLNSMEYQRLSTGLSSAEREANEAVLTRLPHLVTLRVKTIKAR